MLPSEIGDSRDKGSSVYSGSRAEPRPKTKARFLSAIEHSVTDFTGFQSDR